MQISEPVAIFADPRTEIHAVEEQVGFRHGTAGSPVPTGRRQRTLGWGRGRATGEAVRVGVQGQLSSTFVLIFY